MARTRATLWLQAEPTLVADVRRVRWTEALSETYDATIEVVVEGLDFDATSALATDAVVTLEQDPLPPRHLAGVVFAVASADSETADGRTVRGLRIVPGLHVLGLGRRTRVFQDKTALEIALEVLGEGLGALRREVRDDTRGTYAPREHCVQYGESDRAFVERLLAEEGIAYAFEADDPESVETMVLFDHPSAYADPVGEPFAYDPSDRRDHLPRLQAFARDGRLRPSGVTVRDHDWTQPRPVTHDATASSPAPTPPSFEHGRGRSVTIGSYDEGVRRYQAEDTSHQADRRLEAHRADAETARAEAHVACLRPGAKLAFIGHPGVAFDGDYAVTRATHTFEEAGRDEPHRCDLALVDAAIAWRPPRRPHAKPRVASMQTATVVGPAGEEIHCDAHGRIQVQMHWDRDGDGQGDTSCWVRVRQPWAGDGWGFLFLPRVGMEVVVQHMSGDPDRPLVVGCVYDGTHRPPYALPDERTKSTIKTQSSLGGDGFNELRFEDAKGQEQIFLHAQRDLDEVVLNDHSTDVGADQLNHVDHHQTQKIGDWQEETVHGNQTMEVTGKRTVTVGGTFDETIDAGEIRNVSGSSEETIAKGELRFIIGTEQEDIDGGIEERDVHGGLTEVCVGTYEQLVHGASQRTATGAFSKTVTGALTATTPGTMSMTAPAGVSITAAGPVTTNGGPLLTEIHVARTDIHVTTIKCGILKWGFHVVAVPTYGLKMQVGGVYATLAPMKLTGTLVKVDFGVRKTDQGADASDIGVMKANVKSIYQELRGAKVS